MQNMPNLMGALAAFALVVAAIPLALWLLKRTPLGAAAGAQGLRLVASLPLAPNQRVVTVEVGSGDERRWLVLGVSPAGIARLHDLTPPSADGAAGDPPTTLPGFAQLLKSQLGGRAATTGAAAAGARSTPRAQPDATPRSHDD